MTYFALFISLLLFIFSIIFLIYLLESILVGHDISTNAKTLEKVQQIIEKYCLQNGYFCDLGCCRGEFSFELKKSYPKLKIFGIDNSHLRIFFAKMKNFFAKNDLVFIKKDIFDFNLKDFDVVYTYLWWSHMSILEEKFQNELKPGTIIICNESYLPLMKPIETISLHKNKNFHVRLYVYKIN